MTTKREYERQARQRQTLLSLGFTYDEATKLRRISMTLRRWHELECGIDGGCVERDETTNRTYWVSAHSGRRWPYPDRETGAKIRLHSIIGQRNGRANVTPHTAIRPYK